jgi:hypothetical protein
LPRRHCWNRSCASIFSSMHLQQRLTVENVSALSDCSV